MILFRKLKGLDEEFEAASKYLPVATHRVAVPAVAMQMEEWPNWNKIVVGRYAMLPYYDEVEKDLLALGVKPINSLKEHRWIADFEYYEQLKDLTFPSYTPEEFAYVDHNRKAKYVVKGRTNSKKWQWSTSMFAESKLAAVLIGCNLLRDSNIEMQGVIYRDYVPLKPAFPDKDEGGVSKDYNGVPYSEEYRFFFIKEELLASTFYWDIAVADNADKPVPKEAEEFARKIAAIASQYTTAFVVDVAEKAEGGWILVELNELQQSGLNGINPEKFYSKLAEVLGRMK